MNTRGNFMSKVFQITTIILFICQLKPTTGFSKESIFSAANNITFSNTDETKSFVGNGFLISHNGKTYAVTAKHVLLETQESGIKFIDIKDHFKHWRLKPFNSDTGEVVLGQLLNTNSSEELNFDVLKDDWLLFNVSENNSSLIPLKLASDYPHKNQSLHAYGCSYSNKNQCTQNKYTGHYVKSNGHNLLIELNMPSENMNTLRGLSGAPVLNSNNEVVAIVSNVINDKESNTVYFAPFSINPLLNYLNHSKFGS